MVDLKAGQFLGKSGIVYCEFGTNYPHELVTLMEQHALIRNVVITREVDAESRTCAIISFEYIQPERLEFIGRMMGHLNDQASFENHRNHGGHAWADV